MKSIIIPFLIFGLPSLFFQCCPKQSETNDTNEVEEIKAIKAVRKAYTETWLKNDSALY